MIVNIDGDLLEASENIIAHQVNCQAKMRSGIAKLIRNKYPNVYMDYLHKCNKQHPANLLGQCQIVKVGADKYVANLFGQLNYGNDGGVYTNDEALRNSLTLLRDFAIDHKLSVALPNGIGCGLGGGNWNAVYYIIDDVFKNYHVTIYKLN